MQIHLLLILFIVTSFINNENQLNDEFVLKAALIQKLALFIDWNNNDKNDKQFRIATLGNSKLIQSTKENLNNLKVKNQLIEIKDYETYNNEFIHIVILGNLSNKEIDKVLLKINKTQTIIFTDNKNIKSSLYDVFLFIKEGKLSFRLNRELLKNDNFKISYHVLKYAEIIGN